MTGRFGIGTMHAVFGIGTMHAVFGIGTMHAVFQVVGTVFVEKHIKYNAKTCKHMPLILVEQCYLSQWRCWDSHAIHHL